MTDSIDQGESAVSRYMPLAIWILVAVTLIFIPLKIASYGYLPPDDSMRHAAKAASGRPWSAILVVRPEFDDFDSNHGWHVVLSRVRGWAAPGEDLDGLVCFSVVLLFLLFAAAGLAAFRRPEAWAIALLLAGLAFGGVIFRLTLGRPYIFSMAVLLTLLVLWTSERSAGARPLAWRAALSVLLLTLATWIHGSWYLFALPVAAFALSRRWREAGILAGCWVAGSVLGAALTGYPLRFLVGQLRWLQLAIAQTSVQSLLVGEFQPSDGAFGVLVVVAVFILARALRHEPVLEPLTRDPVFTLAWLGWMLGLKVTRNWLDWGLPAALLWIGRETQRHLESRLPAASWGRFALAVFACAALFLHTTADLAGRWTGSLSREYLTTDKPDLEGWLPDQDGIVYSDSMLIFYQTFFKNPHAPWRYVLGFEPAFMPEDDLATYRRVQLNQHDVRAMEPWVRKMRPEDRMILARSRVNKPDIGELEWYYGATGIWIGRLPRAPAAKAPPNADPAP
jgi:hypothetical protein